MPSKPILSVERLRIEAILHPPGEPARIARLVDDVSFTLDRGRVLGLIGESGAGKSTIGLAALAYGRGGCRIAGGRVALDGIDLRGLSSGSLRAVRGNKVSYVAQSAGAAFNPARRIGEQVTEAALRHGLLGRRDAEERARHLFGILSLPDPASFGDRYPHQVSGGQLQRAMTALALCPDPDLVVFDEPTTALDVTTQIGVLAAIRRAISETGTAALYISHDLAVVAQIADDIMVLRHGRTVEYGPARQIVDAPRDDYTRRLVSIRTLEKPTAPAAASETVLTIDHVDAAYGATPVLFDVALSLARGRTLGVVGESGSGKSTLARVIMGLLPPTAGSVLFKGAPLPPDFRRRTREQLRTVQMIYQIPDVALNPRHTVRDIVGRPLRFYFGMRRRAREARLHELLDAIEIPRAFLDRTPSELSGGQKQRICIARALAAQPELIVCDEPTSALDPLMADGVLALLMRLQAGTGVSLVFITHDIATVQAVADDVAVMHRGRVVRSGPRTVVLSPPFDPYTELLLSSVPHMDVGWLDRILAARSGI